MSVRVNWDTAPTTVTLTQPGQRMPDGQYVDPGKWALVIGDPANGAVTVIEGTPEQLTDFAGTVTTTVTGIPPHRLTFKGLLTAAKKLPVGGLRQS